MPKASDQRSSDRARFADTIKREIFVQIQINSDNNIKAGEALAADLEALLRAKLDRFAPRLTRIEVHLKDINGPASTVPDKHCTLEARPNGLDPLSVDSTASSVDQAVNSAAGKLITALDRTFGKLTNRKGH
ncbi:HPF/RaiA family ribosome-associated protein [Polymorphobacter sp.]|uniref:HPF/RaiA family ribosome-associated protein n=1 Tax=Polymorphobacter sp. TaxID=1909290 RepID=UPI003F70FFFB